MAKSKFLAFRYSSIKRVESLVLTDTKKSICSHGFLLDILLRTTVRDLKTKAKDKSDLKVLEF